VFLNQEGRSFRRLEAATVALGDQGAVVCVPMDKGKSKVLVAESVSGQDQSLDVAVSAYVLLQAATPEVRAEDKLPFAGANPGPLAVADIDGDGDLDLFVGGRHRPERYPEPVSSSIWIKEQGEFRLSETWSKPFASLGLVSGAVFVDLNGDSAPDLALAVEWGPIRVFLNAQGRFHEVTEEWGLSLKKGWWTSITAGDFDGDGHLDLAAGNWGLNSPYQLYHPAALRLFYDEPSAPAPLKIVEAWQSGTQWFPVRARPWLARGFPDLAQRFPTHQAFGQATVLDILGPSFSTARFVEVNGLESAVFMNRERHFECIPLPREAQLAPVFGISTADFDNDGREDLFLAQNFFGGGSDISREDAGRGLWLRGLGNGTFTAIDSGVAIHGEQRGAAVADFDHDGKVDFAVAQNNGPVVMYKNAGAQRGLRITLAGTPENPQAVGAQLRIRYAGGGLGPCRVVPCGSGYWSQDGAVQVLGSAGPMEAVWVRWPGGREHVAPVSATQRELQLTLKDAGQ
jgi:hypothetical protein